MTTIIYGASDDLIEVEGDIREEFSGSQVDDQGTYVYVSTGDVLRMRLEVEGWRAQVVIMGNSYTKVVPRPDRPDSGDEAIEVAAPVTWVVVCPFAPTRAPRTD